MRPGQSVRTAYNADGVSARHHDTALGDAKEDQDASPVHHDRPFHRAGDGDFAVNVEVAVEG